MRKGSTLLAFALGLVATCDNILAATIAPTPYNTPAITTFATEEAVPQYVLGQASLGGGMQEVAPDGQSLGTIPPAEAKQLANNVETMSATDDSTAEAPATTDDATSTTTDDATAVATDGASKDATTTNNQTALPTDDNTAEQQSSIVLAISSFECDKTSIDVSNGDDTLTCTVGAASSFGVSTISAAFYNPPMTKRILLDFGNAQLAAGDANSGVWQVTVTVPKAEDQGVWNLGFADQGAFYGLEIADIYGNSRSYQSTELADVDPLQLKLTVQSYTGDALAYPQANVVSSTGVSLYSMTCDQSSVQAKTDAQTVSCIAVIVPDAGGIGETTAYLVGPTGKTVLPITFGEYSTRQLVAATNISDAMWSLTSTLTAPTWAESGKYALASSGPYQPRSVSHAGTIKPINPSTLVQNPSLYITSQGDNAAPVIGSFYCNQGREVDLSAIDPVTVSCLLRASDDYSGISYASLHFVSPSRSDSLEFGYAPQSPGLGPFANNPQRSIAETASVELAPFAEPGAWTLARAVVTDNAGNYREYKATELDKLNVQTFFLIQSPTRTFSIKPKDGSTTAEPIPGKTTSAAPSATGHSATMALFAAFTTAMVCFVPYML